jgi:hypothetical protein
LPFGGIDSKITNNAMVNSNLGASIVNGPTNVNQPPFSWTGIFAKFSHLGMPTTFNFNYTTV